MQERWILLLLLSDACPLQAQAHGKKPASLRKHEEKKGHPSTLPCTSEKPAPHLFSVSATSQGLLVSLSLYKGITPPEYLCGSPAEAVQPAAPETSSPFPHSPAPHCPLAPCSPSFFPLVRGHGRKALRLLQAQQHFSCTAGTRRDPLSGCGQEIPGVKLALLSSHWQCWWDGTGMLTFTLILRVFSALPDCSKGVKHEGLLHCLFIKLPVELWLLGTDEPHQSHSPYSLYSIVTWQQGEYIINISLQSWDYFSLEQSIVARVV